MLSFSSSPVPYFSVKYQEKELFPTVLHCYICQNMTMTALCRQLASNPGGHNFFDLWCHRFWLMRNERGLSCCWNLHVSSESWVTLPPQGHSKAQHCCACGWAELGAASSKSNSALEQSGDAPGPLKRYLQEWEEKEKRGQNGKHLRETFIFVSVFDCSVVPAKKKVWNWISYLEEERMPAAPLKLFREVGSFFQAISHNHWLRGSRTADCPQTSSWVY